MDRWWVCINRYRYLHLLTQPVHLNSFMFFSSGHLLFEMCTGRELATAQPSEKDYKSVPKDVQAVLKYIFEDDSAEIEGVCNSCTS